MKFETMHESQYVRTFLFIYFGSNIISPPPSGALDPLNIYPTTYQFLSFTLFIIKYLGVPLSSKRISAVDCDILVDKMTEKIRS